LEKNAEDVHNQWTSKRIWVRSAAKNVAQLNLDVTNVKLTSRQKAEANQQEKQKRHDVFLHNRNDDHNCRSRREKQIRRK
jgi:hypothetical protein